MRINRYISLFCDVVLIASIDTLPSAVRLLLKEPVQCALVRDDQVIGGVWHSALGPWFSSFFRCVRRDVASQSRYAAGGTVIPFSEHLDPTS